MLEAIVLDFNGVIVDDERFHYLLLRDLMAPFGLAITQEDYLAKYVVVRDEEAFARALAESGREPAADVVRRLVGEKQQRYLDEAIRQVKVFPGVVEFIREASARYPLAIASGAARAEVIGLLKQLDLESHISAVIAAEDVKNGKPAPDAYTAAVSSLECDGLNAAAIEDTPGGIRAARLAGLAVAAVANTFPVEALSEADLIFSEGLNRSSLDRIEALMMVR